MHGASVVRSQLALIALTKRKGDIYGRVHVFPHTLRSIFGRVANPEFLLRFSYVRGCGASGAVCQPLQVAPSNKWSWVRADNARHVDLVNLLYRFHGRFFTMLRRHVLTSLVSIKKSAEDSGTVASGICFVASNKRLVI